MLKQDEIAKRIAASRQITPWIESRVDFMRKLDSPIRAVGHSALGCDQDGRPLDARADSHIYTRSGRVFKKLNEPHLLALGEALFPKIADAVRAAWKLHERLPYQVGFAQAVPRPR